MVPSKCYPLIQLLLLVRLAREGPQEVFLLGMHTLTVQTGSQGIQEKEQGMAVPAGAQDGMETSLYDSSP